VLVNNAGTVGIRGDLIDQDMANIENVMKINVMGTLYMAKYAALVMKEAGKGVIVNVGSLCGAIVNTESVAYHASKGAVRMITSCIAKELAPYGIRVVSAAPGWVATPLLKTVCSEEDVAYGNSLHMTGKIIEPSQIAGAIFALSSDDASAIMGTTVMVDNGYTAYKI
jgi:NAD(P)-dependent dehydrogenase (short-subunit alcohol dehydrogenase family)